MQKVQSTWESEKAVQDAWKQQKLTPESQKQLDNIKELYSLEQKAFVNTVEGIFKKYKASLSHEDIKKLSDLVEATNDEAELKNNIDQDFGIKLLQSDMRNLISSKQKLKEEKDLELKRLEMFQEKHSSNLQKNTKELVMLTLKSALKENGTITALETQKIINHVSTKISEKDLPIKEQKTEFEKALILALKIHSSLQSSEQTKLIEKLMWELKEIEIFEKKTESTSYILQKVIADLRHYIGSWKVYASETVSLTAEERQILILKTKVQIDRLVEQSIEAEILYNKASLTQAEYEDIIQQNLVQMEELSILKKSLEDDASAISLDAIQKYKLGSYRDDSTEVQSLPVLAYIQEKTGHVIIHNLYSSAKLWDENDSLYSGYGIETLADSTATIIFSDESILRLEPLSRVDISNPSDANINVKVENGTIWSRVLKPLLSGDVFTIDTGNISLWVRGTSLYISKGAAGTSIDIVDSYTQDGSPSVTLTEKSGWTAREISKWKQVTIDSSGNVNEVNMSRQQLFQSKAEVWEFVKDDLNYLSLLLDDRERWIYNTPIPVKNDSENFINKISGELQNSLPQNAEKPYLIKNSELQWVSPTKENIYALLKKDILITAIKAKPSWNTSAKVNAVRNADFSSIIDKLWGERKVEEYFDYNVTKDVASKTTLSASQIKDIFINFPETLKQSQQETLLKAKNELSINGGSSVVTGNISLPLTLNGVQVIWDSENTSIIKNTGVVPVRTENADTILTAILTFWDFTTTKDFALTVVPRTPTLQDVAYAYQEYLSWLLTLSSKIPYPASIKEKLEWIIGWNFTLQWSPDEYTLGPAGNIRQPTFTQGDKNWHTPSATFTKGSEVYTHTFTLPTIQKLPESPTEILARVSNNFWDNFIEDNLSKFNLSTGGWLSIKDKTITFPAMQEGVSITYSSNNWYYDFSWSTWEKDPECEVDKPVTLTATFSHPGTTSISKTKSFIIPKEGGKEIGDDCYKLMAYSEYQKWTYDLKYTEIINGATKLTSPSTNKPAFSWTAPNYAGIFPKRWTSEHLNYDISKLELGDDWAIEMSVRWEDLKRNDRNQSWGAKNTGILSIPGQLYLFNKEYKLYKNDTNWLKDFNSTILNWYQELQITSKKLYLNGWNLNLSDINMDNMLYIGAFHNKTQQWDWIIKNIKIYKKSS